jgi:glutathione S-transferase
MRTLYHYPLCPFSRKVRLVLEEKKLDFSLEIEKIWERRPPFLHLNATGTIPVLVDLNGTTIAESSAITEYLQEAYPAPSVYPEDIVQRAEARRIAAWIDDRFSREVSLVLTFEKALKRYYNQSSVPHSGLIREAKTRINFYLDHISWFVDRRRWLAGETFSIADIAVSAHLSIIDYLGDVPWDNHPSAKEWYARIKSRPSFRGLLTDRIAGHAPAAHYTDLDF